MTGITDPPWIIGYYFTFIFIFGGIYIRYYQLHLDNTKLLHDINSILIHINLNKTPKSYNACHLYFREQLSDGRISFRYSFEDVFLRGYPEILEPLYQDLKEYYDVKNFDPDWSKNSGYLYRSLLSIVIILIVSVVLYIFGNFSIYIVCGTIFVVLFNLLFCFYFLIKISQIELKIKEFKKKYNLPNPGGLRNAEP